MICQKCHEREATVYISQVVNQEATQMHLCAECARETGTSFNAAPLNLTPFGDFGDFLNDIIQQAQKMGEQIAQNIQIDPSVFEPPPQALRGRATPAKAVQMPGTPETPKPALQCPHCGYQFAVFQQTGRLGCSRCYESFGPVLQPLIASIHGNVGHVETSEPQGPSTVPASVAAIPSTPAELKARLKEAVAKERFEEAAKLRDEIHALEGKPPAK